jgi:ribosomal protein S21
MTRVVRKPGESFDSLLKRFRKTVTRDRVLSEARKHRYFVSNSENRRIALRKAMRHERKRRYRQHRVYVS